MEKEKELLLYECEINSERFWVAARGMWNAVEVLRSIEPDDQGCDMLTVEECIQARAEMLMFADEDGSKRPMWAEFKTHVEPGLVASTLF